MNYGGGKTPLPFYNTMWDLFDRKVCLTLDGSQQLKTDKDAVRAKNRWRCADKEFDRIGLSDVQKFVAIAHIGPHQSFNASTRQILIEFFESNTERLLFLEDDCVFKNYAHIDQALKELPSDWDIVYFGCNIQDEKPVKITDNLFKINGAYTTHCIGYNKKCIPFILENQPGFSEQMYDNWLAGQKLNAYVINPMAAWQRREYSAIWERDVDYNEHFIQSQKKLA